MLLPFCFSGKELITRLLRKICLKTVGRVDVEKNERTNNCHSPLSVDGGKGGPFCRYFAPVNA